MNTSQGGSTPNRPPQEQPANPPTQYRFQNMPPQQQTPSNGDAATMAAVPPQYSTPAEPTAISPEPSDDGDAKAVIFEVLERVGSLVMPLAIALYAILYISMQYLYGTFGINPEQAGIDQGVLFGRLLYTLVILILVAFPIIGVFMTARWLAQRLSKKDGPGPLRRNPWLSAIVVAVFCALLYWLLMPIILGYLGIDGGAGLSVGMAMGFAIVGFLVPLRIMAATAMGRVASRVICGALAGVTIGFSLAGTVSDEAYNVATNGAESPLLEAVGFQDQWVVVQREDKCLYDGATMLLLGTSDAGYALYDVDLQQAHFLPVGDNITLDYVMMKPTGEDMEAVMDDCVAQDEEEAKDKESSGDESAQDEGQQD